MELMDDAVDSKEVLDDFKYFIKRLSAFLLAMYL